jgi:hypothetical protein
MVWKKKAASLFFIANFTRFGLDFYDSFHCVAAREGQNQRAFNIEYKGFRHCEEGAARRSNLFAVVGDCFALSGSQ